MGDQQCPVCEGYGPPCARCAEQPPVDWRARALAAEAERDRLRAELNAALTPPPTPPGGVAWRSVEANKAIAETYAAEVRQWRAAADRYRAALERIAAGGRLEPRHGDDVAEVLVETARRALEDDDAR